MNIKISELCSATKNVCGNHIYSKLVSDVGTPFYLCFKHIETDRKEEQNF